MARKHWGDPGDLIGRIAGATIRARIHAADQEIE
jgi:hypothetical protein